MKKLLSTVSLVAFLSAPAMATTSFGFLAEEPVQKQLATSLRQANELLLNPGVKKKLLGESSISKVDVELCEKQLEIRLSLVPKENGEKQNNALIDLIAALKGMKSDDADRTSTLSSPTNSSNAGGFSFLDDTSLEERFSTAQQETERLLANGTVLDNLAEDSHLPQLMQQLSESNISLVVGVRASMVGEEQITTLDELNAQLPKMVTTTTTYEVPRAVFHNTFTTTTPTTVSPTIVKFINAKDFIATDSSQQSATDTWIYGQAIVTVKDSIDQVIQEMMDVDRMTTVEKLTQRHEHCVLEDNKKGHRYYHQTTDCTKTTLKVLFRLLENKTMTFQEVEKPKVTTKKVQDNNIHHNNALHGCIHQPGVNKPAHQQSAQCPIFSKS